MANSRVTCSMGRASRRRRDLLPGARDERFVLLRYEDDLHRASGVRRASDGPALRRGRAAFAELESLVDAVRALERQADGPARSAGDPNARAANARARSRAERERDAMLAAIGKSTLAAEAQRVRVEMARACLPALVHALVALRAVSSAPSARRAASFAVRAALDAVLALEGSSGGLLDPDVRRALNATSPGAGREQAAALCLDRLERHRAGRERASARVGALAIALRVARSLVPGVRMSAREWRNLPGIAGSGSLAETPVAVFVPIAATRSGIAT